MSAKCRLVHSRNGAELDCCVIFSRRRKRLTALRRVAAALRKVYITQCLSYSSRATAQRYLVMTATTTAIMPVVCGVLVPVTPAVIQIYTFDIEIDRTSGSRVQFNYSTDDNPLNVAQRVSEEHNLEPSQMCAIYTWIMTKTGGQAHPEYEIQPRTLADLDTPDTVHSTSPSTPTAGMKSTQDRQVESPASPKLQPAALLHLSASAQSGVENYVDPISPAPTTSRPSRTRQRAMTRAGTRKSARKHRPGWMGAGT